MARKFLALSLILNVLFVFVLIGGHQADTLRTVATSGTQQVVLNADGHEATTIRDYHRALSKKELNGKERASLMLAYLEERYAHLGEKQERRVAFCDSSSTSVDQIRAEVLSSLGGDSVVDPVFGCLFQPLGSDYPELSAPKQMAVHQLLRSYNREVEEAAGSRPEVARKASYERLLASASEILSTDEYAEFMVRASPLAKSIQRMSLDLDNSRFRALVQLVARDERLSQLVLDNAAESERMPFHNAEVAELLGSQRYVRFAHLIDPIGAGAPVGKLGQSLANALQPEGQRRSSRSSRTMSVPRQ